MMRTRIPTFAAGRAHLIVLAFAAAVLSTGTAQGAPGGELDATFGENGRLTIPGAGLHSGIVQQADGQLLVVGGTTVLRLHPDGSLDGSFGTNGAATVDLRGSETAELALQPDGRIIVAGGYSQDQGVAMARLNPDGTMDRTFGDDGSITLDFGGTWNRIHALLPLENGHFVVGGTTNANGDDDFAFARFDANGALDPAFGTGAIPGTTVIDASEPDIPSGRYDSLSWITRQLDGKYLACGGANYDDAGFANSTMVAVRLNSDGSLDSGFGNNGVSRATPMEANASAEACLAMPDGTIMLAGWYDFDGATLARLMPDGSRDAGFGNSGLTTVKVGDLDSVRAIILLNDGGLGITGSAGINDLYVARVDAASGAIDPTFGNNGVTIVDFGQENRRPNSVGLELIQQADGKLVVVGDAYDYETTYDLALARIDPAGTGHAGFLGFAESFVSVAEGSELLVSVRRTGGSTGELSVDFNTVAGTAIAPGDFAASSGTLHWTNGAVEPKSIKIPITADGIDELDEVFTVVLSNANGGLAVSELEVLVVGLEQLPPGNDGSGGGAVGMELLVLLAIAGLVVMTPFGRRVQFAGRAHPALLAVLCTGLGACSNGGHTPGNTTPVTTLPPPAPVTPPPPVMPPFEQLSCSPCKKIVFTSSRDGNAEIYSVNADGTELTRLTNNTVHDDSAVWSPDGYRIAFTSGTDLDRELRVMNADGSNVVHHALPHGVHDPSWSPDGRITYSALSDGSSNIWTVDADGGWPVLLFSLPGWEGHPSWAPDGSKLALASDWFAYDFVEDVLLVDPDGAGFTPLTDSNIFDELNYHSPSWSPDSTRIGLTLSRRTGIDQYITHVGVINRDGTGLTPLIPGWNGSWSPDGTMIAFTSGSEGASDVSWVKADGSAWGTITTDGSNPDWQP